MDPPPPGRPFPPLLFWALLVPAVMFVGGVVGRMLRSLSELAMVLFVIPMVMELVAVPIAIYLLARGNYGTKGNVILMLVGAIPAVVFLGMWLFWNLTHFHL